MKAGQICTHGTAATLGVSDANNDKWVAMARKYNQAVNAATMQLFKDAAGVLTPPQHELLKAWFAVGVNPVTGNRIVPSRTRRTATSR